MMRSGLVACGAFAAVTMAVLPSQPAWAAEGGSPDPEFSGGTVSTSLDGVRTAYGVAVQSDGKVVTAGYANRDGNYDFGLVRYTANGVLDPTFGSGGVVVTDMSRSKSYDVGRAVALQPDGKIIVAGQSTAGLGMALARYNTNGDLDASFGSEGKVITKIAGIAYALAVQPDGKVVVTGSVDRRTGNGIALARFQPDGTLDARFATNGVALTTIRSTGSDDVGEALALQSDGTIVVAGHSTNTNGSAFTILRYQSDGTLDPSFGAKGRVVTTVGGADSTSRASAVDVRPDGRIVAAGSSSPQGKHSRFALARYQPDGTLDTSFGDAGTITTQIGDSRSFAYASAIGTDSLDRILVIGSAGLLRTGDFALARYNADGTLDPSFGTRGVVATDFDGGDDRAFGLAFQPDGRALAAGYSASGLALARYVP